MSWVWNVENDTLCNLDHIKSLEIKEIEYEEDVDTADKPTHVLVGVEADSITEDGSIVWLHTGSHAECLQRLVNLSKKIHVI